MGSPEHSHQNHLLLASAGCSARARRVTGTQAQQNRVYEEGSVQGQDLQDPHHLAGRKPKARGAPPTPNILAVLDWSGRFPCLAWVGSSSGGGQPWGWGQEPGTPECLHSQANDMTTHTWRPVVPCGPSLWVRGGPAPGPVHPARPAPRWLSLPRKLRVLSAGLTADSSPRHPGLTLVVTQCHA